MSNDFQEAKILHCTRIQDAWNKKKFEESDTADEGFRFLQLRKIEIPMVNDLVLKLKDKGWNSQQIGRILAEIAREFWICDVVCFKDLAMTQSFSQATTCSRDFGLTRAFEIVTATFDLQHIQVILKNYPYTVSSILKFSRYIINNIGIYDKTQSGRHFLQRVFSWEFFSEDRLQYLENALENTTEMANVKIFLQYNFHVIAKVERNRDILACLFGNSNLKIMSLLKDDEIDVNGCGYGEYTPLHFAAHASLPDNMRIILNKGANPNALSIWETTPLKLAVPSNSSLRCFQNEYECVRLLLLAGANPYCIFNQVDAVEFMYTHSSEWSADDFLEIVKLLVAQALIFEALGHPIKDPIKAYVRVLTKLLGNFYEECRMQLRELKECKIRDNFKLTMLSILAESPEKIARYLTEEDLQLVNNFIDDMSEKLNSFYKDLLRKHVEDITQINHRRIIALRVVCEFTGINDPDHLVVNKIANYITDQDMQNLLRPVRSSWLQRYNSKIWEMIENWYGFWK